jgi:Holliday junction resolvase
MSSVNKRRGSQWERDLEEHLNTSGLKARRLPRSGTKDIGDIAIEGKHYDIVVEAKNVRSAWDSMKQYLREADVEACHYELRYHKPTIGVVATKTRQSGAGEGRIVLTVDQFVSLLRWGGVA